MNAQQAFKKIYNDFNRKRLRNAMLLNTITDEELLFIKGHLLIEEVLHELLSNKMTKPKVIEKARISFAQLIILVEGLYYEKEVEVSWFFRAAEKLNKARNKLAHNIQPENITNDINNFTKYVIRHNINDNFKPKNELLYSLGSLYLNFLALLTMEKKFSIIPPPFNSMTHASKITICKLITNGTLDKLMKSKHSH